MPTRCVSASGTVARVRFSRYWRASSVRLSVLTSRDARDATLFNWPFAICPLPCAASASLLPIDAGPQGLARLRRRDEETLRHFRYVPQHVRVDRIRLVEIQPQARQVLQPQVSVAVDGRIPQPRLEIRFAACVRRE